MKMHALGAKFRFVMCMGLVGLLPFVAHAQPASTAAYSADFVFETAEMAQTGRIFASAGKERRETVMEGMTMTMIRRDDLGKLYMLMPSERMYMEMPVGQDDPSGMTPDNPADYEIEMTEVGPEELQGLATVKNKVMMTDGEGNKMGGFWWITADGIPVKMDMLAIESGNKMRLKQVLSNIVPGEPDPAQFEIPADYQSMGGMMGMGTKMPGMPDNN
jgi:hypothetical protein